MGLKYIVLYHPKVAKEDIPSLGGGAKKRIQEAIESKLMKEPDLFGKPLRRSLAGFRSLRVGEYRVIFLLQKSTVVVYMIAHRSRVYEDIDRRI
jgi:mRNA interferase RelE/StbE